MMIAALYIDRGGPYPRMPDVDCWDEERDARKYDGPYPVVAHPPCGPWGALKHMRVPNRERRTADADCMGPAVAAVRRWGGVLEQPAGSAAFAAFGMPAPGAAPDEYGGYTIEVAQCEWWHVARKRTWLYLVGVPRGALEAPPYPGRAPTHWVSGGRKHDRKGSGGVVPPHIKVCSAQQRRRTPPLFAEYLVRLARAAAVSTQKKASSQ
jgi:hypothetical protein